jgi:hypothetical protein
VRDAATESLFFSIYANMFSMYIAEKHEAQELAAAVTADPRELPFVKEALASIAEGGYPEAFARLAYMLAPKGDTPLSVLVLRKELADAYRAYLPDLPLEQWRRIRGEQEIIARYEPDKAIDTLPDLLEDRADRERLLTLLDKLMEDKRVQFAQPTPEQQAMLERIHEVLAPVPAPLLARGAAAIPAPGMLH